MTQLTDESLRELLLKIKHPAIDLSLLELGIIRKYSVDGDDVNIEFAWPFPGIPIRNQLIYSVQGPLTEIGANLKFTETIMDESEKQRFLMLEQAAWKG
ncbi:MAG: iron-sulfur cluster assembly protein [Candidatus Thorarchaeota archaeon]|nr:iron-sulfur cluster assembly protein [Candidatus Thorarchaeota archaeon]